MRPKQVKELLRRQLEKGSNPDEEFGSLFLWGPPGIGKSRVVEDVARETGVGCIDFRLILCDPTDLRGIPMPYTSPDGKQSAVWIPPDELPRDGAGFLFFDDFPTAPPLVQGAAYQIAIRPHQLGPYKLPEKYVVIAAGNRIQDRALAHRIPTALANRFRHVEFEVNIDDWVDWA
ncbi:MoxR family ATPase, partial [Patescibacteria group bacterium]|nr:MoxR family ATPase [Patescibacteria group bacterium]